jgi:hypothetical protein
MSLFTSNFRSEARVLISLVAVAAAVEGGLRATSGRLSTDITHIRGIPGIAAEIAETRGKTVLFLGNSLTREGLDLDAVREALRCAEGEPIFCERVCPDDTTVLDWYYLFRHYFVDGRAPDYLVVGYVRSQLEDRSPIHPDRIAAYFGGWSSAGEMLRMDLKTLGDRVSYMLASSLQLFSERERVQFRAMSLAVPDYRKVANRVNEEARRRDAGLQRSEPGQYSRLSRLLELCAERGVKPVIVAMPVPDRYRLDPGLQAVLSRNSAGLIDLRSPEGIGAEAYADNYHLNSRGRSIYSRALGRELRGVIGNCPAPATSSR